MLSTIKKIALIVMVVFFSLPSIAEDTMSADKAAKELANPNTALASLNFKFQYRSFKGDLPDAGDQDGTMILFQPSLPFPRDDGSKIIFRPAIPFMIDQPVFGAGGFKDEGGVGDTTFDLVYAPKMEGNTLKAFGVFGTLPTGDDDLGMGETTALGPDFFYGKLNKTNILGSLFFHQWDIDGDIDVNQSNLQVFGVLLPGGGWNYGSSPTFTYDWEGEQWTVPLNFSFGKTVMWNSRPWKLGVEINYYVEQPDAFGPEWMLSFNVSPVVENVMANWFK